MDTINEINWLLVTAVSFSAALVLCLAVFSSSSKDGGTDANYPLKIVFIASAFLVNQAIVSMLIAAVLGMLLFMGIWAAIGGGGSAVQAMIQPTIIGAGIVLALCSILSLYLLNMACRLKIRSHILAIVLVPIFVFGECKYGFDVFVATKPTYLYGYIDHTGNFKIPPTYGEAWMFHNGIARVTDDPDYSEKTLHKEMYGDKFKGTIGETYYINKNGEVVTPTDAEKKEYMEIIETYQKSAWQLETQNTGQVKHSTFSEGLAIFRNSEQRNFGFINESMNTVVMPAYYDVRPFSEGRAAVNNNGGYATWGFIDKTGNPVILPQYREAYSFSEGLAVVAKSFKIGETDNEEKRFGAIDKSGREMIPFIYKDMRPFREGLAPARVKIDKKKNEKVSQYQTGK